MLNNFLFLHGKYTKSFPNKVQKDGDFLLKVLLFLHLTNFMHVFECCLRDIL